MNIAVPLSEAYSYSGQFELSFDNKLTTLPVLPVEWTVTFDFIPDTSYDRIDWTGQGAWLNVLHVTSDSCGGPTLCRVPAVFFNPIDGNGIYVQWRHDSFGPHYIWDLDWSLSDWTKVEISQELEGNEVVCKVNINGVEKFREKNMVARKLTNLDVYASDPWHLADPALGHVRDLLIQIKEDPKPRIGN